jgi:hypothetical protein
MTLAYGERLETGRGASPRAEHLRADGAMKGD